MPAIDLTTTSTFTGTASAFGPNASGVWTNLILKTTQTPVTAFVTAYTFNNAISTSHDEGYIFTFAPSGLDTFPAQVRTAGRNIALSARVYDGCRGVHTASLVLTLSSLCLSGAAWTPTAVTNTSQTISFPLTCVNLAYRGNIDQRSQRRKRYLGYA